MPPFLSEVLAELSAPEDPDVPAEVAAAWAASEEMDAAGTNLLPVVRSVVQLVADARAAGRDVYLWVEAD